MSLQARELTADLAEHQFEHHIDSYSVDALGHAYTLFEGQEDQYNLFMYPETKYSIPILITNTGNGIDTFSLGTAQTSSSEYWLYYFWNSESIGFSTNVTLTPGETKIIYLQVDPPINPAYNFSNYEFKMISQSGLGNSHTINFTSQLLIPELEFTGTPSLSSTYRSDIVDGAPIRATFRVSNTGYTPSGPITIEFYDNGKLVDTKEVSLEEGETKSITGKWDLRLGDTGEHKIEAKIKYGDGIVENNIANNVASITVSVSFNGVIWIPVAFIIFAYIAVTSTLRFGWGSRYETVLNECNELNKKIRLDEPLALLDSAKKNVGIAGTLTWTIKSLRFINNAQSLKDEIEEKYQLVLERRDEVFSLVSMLKERGLDYNEAGGVLDSVQKQLNSLRPENYSGLEMPDAEKFEIKSISDLQEIQEATVVEILEEEEK